MVAAYLLTLIRPESVRSNFLQPAFFLKKSRHVWITISQRFVFSNVILVWITRLHTKAHGFNTHMLWRVNCTVT